MAACDIVIPFYQREPGVLSRALDSIAAQTFQDYRVIVVDDGSPSPAGLDIDPQAPAARDKIHLVQQANAGVSAARNTGLRTVSDTARFVAFLDSDDAWTPDHLARAARAFEAEDVDLFWDALAPDETFGDFRAPGAMIDPALQAAAPDAGAGFAVTNLNKVLCRQWWRHMHLSCTAISGRLARTLRFREDLGYCEDFEFFRQGADAARRVIAQDAPGVARGSGDNLWHGVDGRHPRYAVEKYTMMTLFKVLKTSSDVDAEDRAHLDMRLQVSREQFYWNQVHRFKSGDGVALGLWARWIAHDPRLIALAASLIFKTNKNGGKTVIPDDDWSAAAPSPARQA